MSPSNTHLIITTSYPRFSGDSAGHFVEADVAELLRNGSRVRVLAAGGPRSHSTGGEIFVSLGGDNLFAAPGVLPRLRSAPWRLFGLFTAFFRLERLLKSSDEKSWTVHFISPLAWRAAHLAKKKGAALEVVAHGSDVRLFLKLPRRVQGAFLRSLVRANANLRFVSRELESEFLAVAPNSLWPIRTRVEPSAIEIPELPEASVCREELGVPSDVHLVVIVGRLIPSKRVGVALSALELLDDTHVVVLGDGPERGSLSTRFPEAQFLGHVERPVALRWMRAAELLVSASCLEGAPTNIREARALGTPVVATSAGDLGRVAAQDPELWLVSAKAR